MIIEIADVDVVFNQGIPIVESCDRYDSPVGLQSLLSISDGLYIVQSDVDLESGRISEINLNVVERLFGLDRVEIKATFYVYGDEWVSSRIGYQNSIEFLMNHVHKPEVFAYLRTDEGCNALPVISEDRYYWLALSGGQILLFEPKSESTTRLEEWLQVFSETRF